MALLSGVGGGGGGGDKGDLTTFLNERPRRDTCGNDVWLTMQYVWMCTGSFAGFLAYLCSHVEIIV